MARAVAGLLTMALLVLIATAAACGGDSDGGLNVLGGQTASPNSSPSPSASPSPTASASPTATTTASPSSSPTDAGGGSAGDLSADEFSSYLDEVQPWYEEIIAVEADIIDVIARVEENTISPGQGGRRIERLGWKLDPPVQELAYMTPPAALDDAHTAWLDGISFEARAFARVSELMAKGTYQRGAVDPQYDALFRKASDKWTVWSDAVKGYETELGVEAPWSWPDE